MCHDTSQPIIFVKVRKVEVDNLYDGIGKGVEQATNEIPLRPNVVDHLTHANTGQKYSTSKY